MDIMNKASLNPDIAEYGITLEDVASILGEAASGVLIFGNRKFHLACKVGCKVVLELKMGRDIGVGE
ncbi:hypothetical protein LCGC14_1438710 [marine sediment metagenome]|uniref:Uncharacterized protein n=1 Tax=marine sediment metagenome TaxID=412755 RepID=A0A0F9K7I5_9ZZZZ